MTKIKVLDCTLRDGGYYAKWDFDKELVQDYIKHTNYLPIEYLEIGYRSKLKDEYLGEYFYLPESTIRMIKEITTKKLSIMLNAKDCKVQEIRYLLSNLKEDISLIRIATDPQKMSFSLLLAKEIKKMGFDVAINVMYISSINKSHDFFQYLDNIENHIVTLNLVDSYGSIYSQELEKLINRIRERTNISLGFHGHNNLELAFSNTLKAIECGIELIDSTILGMGRGAGNLKTELILTYLKSQQVFDVDLDTIGKLVELFNPLKTKYNWGTNFPYIVSGSYSLPQKNVMEALEINRYSLSGIVNQLKCDNVKEVTSFECKDNYEQCLIIGGGINIDTHMSAIKNFLLLNKDILIIHSSSKYISLFEGISNVQYLAVAGDELLKLENAKNINKYILEPSPRKVNSNINNITEKFTELKKITFLNKYLDSPLTISLQITLDLKIKDVYLAGFDGYSELKSKKELYLMQENQEIINSFINKNILISLTSSKYKNLKQKSIYGIIS